MNIIGDWKSGPGLKEIWNRANEFLHVRPLHSFLVCLYIIFFTFAHNVNKVNLSMTYRTMVFGLFLSILVFVFSRILIRHPIRAGILSTLFQMAAFSYGILYNFCEDLYYRGYWPFSNIHRYLVLTIFAFSLAGFVFLKKSGREMHKVNFLLNFLLCLLISANFLTIGVSRFFPNKEDSAFTSNPFLKESEMIQDLPVVALPDTNLPDVYYIILDGYANGNILQNQYDYNNSPFLNSLKEMGFYIAENSKCNYPSTRPSLSSSLNYDYLDNISGGHYVQGSPVLITQNRVSKIFRNLGYEVIHMASGYAVTNSNDFATEVVSFFGPNEFERQILSLTIFRLDDLTGITTYFRLKDQFEFLKQLPDRKSPKFSIIHLVCPHPPFVFNNAGDLTLRAISDMSWETRENYIGQLRYLNQVVEKFLKPLVTKPGQKPIVLLQSDHGPWLMNDDPDVIYESRIGILQAFYFPESYKPELYDSISPVNTFRVVFNQMLGTNLPLLKDIPPEKKSFFESAVFRNYLMEVH